MDISLSCLIKTILDNGFSIQQSPIFSLQSVSSKLPVAALPISSFHFEVQQCPGQHGVTGFLWKPVVVLLMAEIRRSPVEVGSLSHHLQGFSTIPGGCLGFLASTVSQ